MPIPDEAPAQHDTLEGIPSPAETVRLVGHDKSADALREALESGRLHHAWLLQGPPGIGKATLAFAFARQLLSGGGASRDAVYAQISKGSHPNLLHLTRPAAERGGFKTQITVDEVRRLNRFFHTTAAGDRWRIAIVDPVDDMNRSAANALLKTLEEPPARALFLLVNHLPGRLLPTIRSRCRVLRFEPLAESAVAEVLAGLDLPMSAGERTIAAARAEGSVRNAIMLLTSGGIEIEKRLDALLATPEPEWHGIHALADQLAQKGGETAFDLAVASLLSRLAGESERAARAGRLAEANRHAQLWQEENNRFRDGLTYNVDRKQLLLTHVHKRFALRRSRMDH